MYLSGITPAACVVVVLVTQIAIGTVPPVAIGVMRVDTPGTTIAEIVVTVLILVQDPGTDTLIPMRILGRMTAPRALGALVGMLGVLSPEDVPPGSSPLLLVRDDLRHRLLRRYGLRIRRSEPWRTRCFLRRVLSFSPPLRCKLHTPLSMPAARLLHPVRRSHPFKFLLR